MDCALARCSGALSIKPFESSRPAADAGPMQIESSKAGLSSCGRAARQSAKDNRTRRRVGRSAKRMLTERVEKLLEGISSVAKRRGAERAETRDGFEFEKVVSCGSGDWRWRTKLYLGSCEPFDDHHWSTTLGAAPKIGGAIGGGGVWLGGRFLRCAEQMKAKGQERGTSAVGQKTKVSDAYEALRKQMQQKAAQEFIER